MRALQGSDGADAARAGALLEQATRLAPGEPTYRIDLANFHAARAVSLGERARGLLRQISDADGVDVALG